MSRDRDALYSGYNLPPGCTTADIDRAAGADEPEEPEALLVNPDFQRIHELRDRFIASGSVGCNDADCATFFELVELAEWFAERLAAFER